MGCSNSIIRKKAKNVLYFLGCSNYKNRIGEKFISFSTQDEEKTQFENHLSIFVKKK